MNPDGYIYQFTLKTGRRAFYSPKNDTWAIEIDYSQLVEPTIQETTEILQYIVQTAMDTWGEIFNICDK